MNRPTDPSLEQPRPTYKRAAARLAQSPQRRIGLALIACVGSAAVLYFGYQRLSTAPPPAAGQPGGPPRPTPVVAVPAERADVPIYLNGLGTITPLQTVTVRSRVDGELLRVAFVEGQIVKAGQLLAEIDPRSFEVQRAQAEGQLARDRALLENAQLDLARYETLFRQDSIARQQVDTQAALVRQYEATVQVDQGQVDNARLQLGYTRITAPVGGRVGLRLVDPGNIVHAGDANGLVIITQLRPITALFTIPQDNLPAVMQRIQSGDKLPAEAWDRAGKVRLAVGALDAVDNTVDPATGTVKLKARFANDDASLFPQQFVNVRMQLDTARGATVIPSAALQRGSQGMFVYVVKDDQTVSVRPIKLGPAEGERIAIAEGLVPGERVVTDGMDRLREGAAVAVTTRPDLSVPPDGRVAKQSNRKGAGKGGRGRGQPPQ